MSKKIYQITFVATWIDEVEADSQEQAEEILDKNWTEMTFGYDTKLLNVETEINEL